MKQVVRLIADVGTALDEVEDNQEETKKLNIAMKKTNAMLSICRGHHTQKDFCSSFDEAEKFAQMAPAIDEIPCPVWLRQLRYSHQVGKCDTPSSFWVLLSPAEMVKAKIFEADFEAKQVEVVSAKLMDVMRNDDQATQANLASWCDLTDLKHVGLKVKVEEEVRHVHTVASYDKMADDDVDALEVSVAAVMGHSKQDRSRDGGPPFREEIGRSCCAVHRLREGCSKGCTLCWCYRRGFGRHLRR